jgi:hypothetical protein
LWPGNDLLGQLGLVLTTKTGTIKDTGLD